MYKKLFVLWGIVLMLPCFVMGSSRQNLYNQLLLDVVVLGGRLGYTARDYENIRKLRVWGACIHAGIGDQRLTKLPTVYVTVTRMEREGKDVQELKKALSLEV